MACGDFDFVCFRLDWFLNEPFERGYVTRISRLFGPNYPSLEAPKSFFFSGLFRNCLNCDSLRWSHTHFLKLVLKEEITLIHKETTNHGHWYRFFEEAHKQLETFSVPLKIRQPTMAIWRLHITCILFRSLPVPRLPMTFPCKQR